MSKAVDGQKMRHLASMVKEEIPGVGFAILVFDFGGPGVANYVSNAAREDMVLALKETASRLEAGMTFPTPEKPAGQ